MKLLIRKQMTEIFRAYFYNPKKNTAVSRTSTILKFVLFGVLMLFLAAALFGVMSVSLISLAESGYAWFYFAIIGLIAVLLGCFGSVFSTYSGLYLAKDNDLLLAMPIPVRAIMVSRLVSVYLMGLMYSAVGSIPPVVVYFLFMPFSVSGLIIAILWILMISLVVLFLSCLLGYVVARLSLKLKRKSLATTLIALVGIGLYYFIYFKAMDLMQDVVANVVVYGEKVKGTAYGVYLFGQAAVEWKALLIVCAVVLALCAATWFIVQRSFLKVATATGAVSRVTYTERAARVRSIPSALLGKELGRFTSSSNYMLNCGLGSLLMVLAGVMLLVKGSSLVEVLSDVFGAGTGVLPVLACAAVCLASSVNDMAAPSVALEGKNLWVVKSLPVSAWQVLRAKLSMQLLLTCLPVLFLSVCMVIVLPVSAVEAVFLLLTPQAYVLFTACLGLTLGLHNPNLHWTSEIYPIKQSMAVTMVLLGGMVLAMVLGGLYVWKGYQLGLIPYLSLFTAAMLIAAGLLYLWLQKRGAAVFEAL